MKSLFIVTAILFASVLATAQEVSEQVYAPVEMVDQVVTFISAVPFVGPYVAFIMGILFLVSNMATILSTAWVATGKLLVGTLGAIGAGNSADKVEAFMKSISPWLKYLSSYNVKKPLTLPWKSATPPAAPNA